jgi:phosphotransferase system IIA component
MPTSSASSASDPATGEIKAPTAAQVKFLKQKIDAIQLPESAVAALLVRIGAASLDALSFEQYDQVRAELLALE